jgi:hypothetical protein
MFDSLTTDSRANWLFQSEFLRFVSGKMRFCPSERKPRVNAVFSGRIRRTAPERGCVEDQPQQLRKTSLLEYA